MRTKCSNCGKSIPKRYTACDGCSHVVAGAPEKLQVDHKFYDSLTTGKNQAGNTQSGITSAKRRRLIFAAVAVTAISIILSSSFLSKKQNNQGNSVQTLNPAALLDKKSKEEVQVVIMKSGKTYYAGKIEYFGNFANITSRDGSMQQVPKEKISQISTAVLEQ